MRQRVLSETGEGDKVALPYIQSGNRRDYKLWFKLQVVRETFEPGASVSVIARRHNINSNVLFRWRQGYRNGMLKPSARVPANERVAAVGMIGEEGGFLHIPAKRFNSRGRQLKLLGKNIRLPKLQKLTRHESSAP
jgi:transposase-like protein